MALSVGINGKIVICASLLPVAKIKWRRRRDSNSRDAFRRPHAFQACALNHSATSPYQNLTIKYKIYYSNISGKRRGVVPRLRRGPPLHLYKLVKLLYNCCLCSLRRLSSRYSSYETPTRSIQPPEVSSIIRLAAVWTN